MNQISGLVVGTNVTDDVSSRVLSMDISLTTDMASQLTFTVADPGLQMLRANYFQVRQSVKYLEQNWEVASLEVRPGSAGEEIVMECRLAAVQLLKRDKGGRTFSEGNATAFAAARAREVGLRFFGESSAAKGTISRVRNEQTDESTWDVLIRLAGENQFWCFESDGRLFFCSQQFLLGKFAITIANTNPGFLSTRINWATNGRVVQEDSQPTLVQARPAIPGPSGRPTIRRGATGVHVRYLQQVLQERAGQTVAVNGTFGSQTLAAVKNLQMFFGVSESGTVGAQTWATIDFLASGVETVGGISPSAYSIIPLGVPNVRKSDDSPEEMSASFKLERGVGRDLRPGMTVFVDGVPGFAANCLITDVSWAEGTTDPVSVNARTTEVPASAKDRVAAEKRISLTGGGFTNVATGEGVL